MSRRAALALACAIATGAVTLAYSNHFDNAFHFDDHHVIVNNLAIRSLDDVRSFFTDASTYTARPQNASYRPLLTLGFAVDYAIGGGLRPRQFHRTQFALLLLCGLLLAYVYRRLFDLGRPAGGNAWAALFAATLFCIHTANTETVNYVSSRSSLIATLAVAGSFALYLGWPAARRLQLHLVPMLVGGLAKPLTVMFAPLLFLFVLFFEERVSPLGALRQPRRLRDALVRTLPAWVAGAALFLLVTRMESAALEYAHVDRWTYLRTQPFVWLHYFRLFLWPRGLTADTDWRVLDSWTDPRLALGLAFLAALATAVVWLAERPALRPAAFGLAWFAVALLPTSSVFPLSEVYNEHRIFFPYAGLAAAATRIAAAALGRLARRTGRRPAVGLAAALAVGILAAHGIGTHARNEAWRSDETLWRDVTRKSPGNGRGWMNYGLTLMRRGNLEGALEHFERARALVPNYSVLEINLGIVHSALGRHEASEPHFRRALELTPDYAQGRYYYARWLQERGRGPEALEQVRAALRISPRDLDANVLALRLHAAAGDDAALAEQARRMLSFAADHALARAYAHGEIPLAGAEATVEELERLGLEQIQREGWLDAAAIYAHAVRRGSTSAIAWNNLGWARAQLGFFDEAIPCFRRAIELDPELEVAPNNLAWAERRARGAS